MERNDVLMASPIPLDPAKPAAATALHEIMKGSVQASFSGVPFSYTQSPSYPCVQSVERHLQWQHFS